MERRTFIGVIAGGFLAAPLAAAAQQPRRVWRIGLFHVGTDHVPPSLDPLKDTLKALGYEDGQNLRLDWRNLPDEAAANGTALEFVRNRVDLIVAFEDEAARAAKAATAKIPIVFVHVTDPVAQGFVKSFSHPGGNLTGPFGSWNCPPNRSSCSRNWSLDSVTSSCSATPKIPSRAGG